MGGAPVGRRVPAAVLPVVVVAALTLGTTGQGWSAASPVSPGPSADHGFGSHLALAPQAPAALGGAVVRAPDAFLHHPGADQARRQPEGLLRHLGGVVGDNGARQYRWPRCRVRVHRVGRGVVRTSRTDTASDAGPGDEFGISVALSGTAALIRAEGSQSGGSAYVFIERAGVWQQQAELIAPGNTGPYNFFGSSVALSGTRALIGANNTNTATGAAYVFTESNGVWSEQAALTA
jgi:hypothetical protein